MRAWHGLVLGLLAPGACSLTSSLDDLKQNSADASAGGEAGTAGSGGLSGGGGNGGTVLTCEPGACGGCIGCEAFCNCSAPGPIARDNCIKGCTDGGNGGAAGSGGSGGADASASQECVECINQSCASEVQNCTNNSPCIELWNCLVSCNQDADCQNACLMGAPSEVQDALQALNACVANSCAGDCS